MTEQGAPARPTLLDLVHAYGAARENVATMNEGVASGQHPRRHLHVAERRARYLLEQIEQRLAEPVRVLLTNHDAVTILAGRELSLMTADERPAKARLFTPDELLKAATATGERLEAEGLPPGPGMTRADAVRLTNPLKETRS